MSFQSLVSVSLDKFCKTIPQDSARKQFPVAVPLLLLSGGAISGLAYYWQKPTPTVPQIVDLTQELKNVSEQPIVQDVGLREEGARVVATLQLVNYRREEEIEMIPVEHQDSLMAINQEEEGILNEAFNRFSGR